MLTKRVAIQPSLDKPKISAKPANHEQDQNKRYQEHYDRLNRLIGLLPHNCIYAVAAQEVLNKAKYVKENYTWKLPDPMGSVIETLIQTIDILTPLTTGIFRASLSPARVLSLDETNVTLAYDEFDSEEESETIEPIIISDAYLAQLQKYEKFGRSLQRKGGLQILAGVVFALIATILFALYIATVVFLFSVTLPASPVVSYLILGQFISLLCSALSILNSFGLISNGIANRGLASSVQGLMSKVKEHVTSPASKPLENNPFERGLTLLDTKVDAALDCFRQVPKTSPQYASAQELIQIYTPKKGDALNSPSKQSVFRLDPSYREREAKASAQRREDRELEVAVSQTAPGARRRLDFSTTDEYWKYLLNTVVDDQAEERERIAVAAVNR